MDRKFLLDSSECEILLAFEQNENLTQLAETLGKDISVVSRNLKSIAEKSGVIEKSNGRWQLTEKGKSVNRWTSEAIQSQKIAMNRQGNVRIGTTREFASRILLPKTRDLIGEENITVSIVSSDQGVERMILSGEVDFGFDCGRPRDPRVGFKRVLKEPFVVVAAPSFIQKHQVSCFDDLKDLDLLKFVRTESVIWNLEVEATRYYGTFTDVANLRQACLLGYGWAILPLYAVKQEIEEGSLSEVPGLDLEDERYGVWWLKERPSVQPWVDKAIGWLKSQSLG